MKTKLTLIGTMAVACAAIQLTAMPTEEETKLAEPVVKKLLAPERAAFKSGKKTRSEVAAAAMKLADEANTDAAKLLLIKGAFVLYVRDGNLEKAVETMNALETAISDMPPQSVTNMIEAALLGVSEKDMGARLYKLLDEPRLFDKQTATFPLAQGIDLEMIKCPAGEFMMGYESWNTWGSSQNRQQRKLHRVKLTKNFMLGKFPVTYSQWYAIMENGKKAPKGLEDTPVGNITVSEMEAFCEKLTAKFKAQLGGKVFRLPTDAEWEYASKGGKNLDGLLGKTPGFHGNSGSSSRDGKEVEAIFRQMGYTAEDHARASDTNKPFFMWNPLAVGKYKPNEWGFMDLTGNAWEVTADTIMDTVLSKEGDISSFIHVWNGRQIYSDFEIDPLLKGERHLVRTGFWEKGIAHGIGNKMGIGDNDRFPAVGFRVCIGEPLGDWNNAKVADQQRVEAERQPQNEEEKLKREAEREEQRRQLQAIQDELREQRRNAREPKAREAELAAAQQQQATVDAPAQGMSVAAKKLQSCDFLLNKDFKKNAKYYLCLFSASWCPPCRREMPRIAKTYAESLKGDPSVELIHFSCDQNDEKALAWAKEHDVKFPVVKPNGGNPLDLHSRGIPHLFIVDADGKLIEEGHPAKLFTDEKLNALKAGAYVKPETVTEKTRKAIAKLFPGWSLSSEVPQLADQTDHYSGFYASHRGQNNIIRLHPVNMETPVVLSRTVKLSGNNPCLSLSVSSWCDDADFQLSVRVNGKDALTNRIVCTTDAVPWEDIVIPLSPWRGSSVKLEIILSANNWWCEWSHLARVDIVEADGDMSVKEGKQEVDGYTWSYRAQNGEATIVAENDGRFSTAVSPCPVGSIKIPATLAGAKVTHIGRDAFRDCSALTSVTIPEGVVRIGRGAFRDCTGLKSITIPSSVKIIERDAFAGCNALASVSIPDGVKIIDRGAFYGCGSLTSVTMRGERPDAPKNIFERCGKLKSIHVPANAKSWDGMKEWQGITLVKPSLLPLGGRRLLRGQQRETELKAAGEESITEKARKDVARLFPGWSLDSKVLHDNNKDLCSGFHASHRGQNNVIYLHPANRETPVVLSRTVTLSDKNPCLFLKIASWDEGSDFLLSVRVNGKYTMSNRLICTPDIEPWEDLVVPLFDWRGSLVKIEIILSANNWWSERAQLARLEIAEGNGREKCGLAGIEDATVDVDGYTWSYRVRNGEATIVAEKDGKYSCAVSPAPTGKVSIPATLGGVKVTRIGRSAFLRCGGLTSVTIPPGVTGIDESAFFECGNLAAVTIPSSVKSIQRAAFYGCCGLKSVTIPEGVEVIGWDAFQRCTSLTSLTIPSSVTNIWTCAFCKCSGLKSVTILSDKMDIGPGVFKECGALASVTMPPSMTRTKIWQDAFNSCGSLASITIPPGIIEIGRAAFWGCRELGSVTIPASVTNIESWAFCGCEALMQINVAEGNQRYASVDGVLYTKDLTELVMCPNGRTSATIHPSAKRIRADAFRGCAKLTSVTIPANVESIGDAVFSYCGALEQINVDARNQKYTSIDGSLYTKDLMELVMAPGGVKTVPIHAGVKRITTGAFKGCSTLTSVTIPAGVDRILPWTFEGCSSLASVTIQGEVTYIGTQAFWACCELTSFTIRGERPDAPNNIFQGCGKLKSIHVPANAKSWAGMKDWQGIPLVFDGKDNVPAQLPADMNGTYCVIDISGGSNAEHYPVSYLDDVPEHGWGDEYKTTKIVLRRVDAGTYPMLGGRQVTFTKPFYIGIFELTQKQIKLLSGDGDRKFVFEGDMRPADCLTWEGMRGKNEEFDYPKTKEVAPDSIIGRLRVKTGLFGIDLPTSYQFRCAWNAGTDGRGRDARSTGRHSGNQRDGKGGSRSKHTTVGSYLPNEWGIYDLHGNVWEMCLDRLVRQKAEVGNDPIGPIEGAKRYLMGGCWNSADGFLFSEFVPQNKEANGQTGKTGCRIVINVEIGKETIDGVEWTYSIKGGKAQLDYASSSNVTGSITIPSTLGGCPVTSVGRNEFRSGFGWRVFEECCNMTSVAIPSGVMNIGDSAFFGCSNMVSVAIPASVTNIARCAFSRCDSLSSVVVDEENAKYSSRNGMLCSKDGATLIAGVNGDVSIPPCVKNIEDYAFQGRSGLKSVIVPSSVTSVGISAFSDCRGLKSVAIPASVKKIGWYAFSGCSGLMSFSVDPDNPSYSARDGMLCSKDGSKLIAGVNGDVTIPPSVKEIGWYAFSNYDGLKSVKMPENVTSIAQGAFKYCGSLASVMISSRVTSIEAVAFYSCKKLVSVTIPSSVIKIERSAFSGCEKLMSFTVDPDNPSYSSRNGLLCSKDGSTLVCGVNGDVTIPSSVKNIGDNAFSGCTGLTSVTIPSSVTNIGYQAFDKCEELTSVAIPSSVKSIGSRAFTMCYKIKSVTMSEGVTSIGEYVFAWCEDIESVTIPHGVTSIKESAFAECCGLKSVSIPTSVESIGDNAFYNCSGLTSVTIPSSVNSIGIGAFYDCSALKTVAIPSSVTSIGRKAFGKTQFYDGMTNGMVILGGGVLYGYKGECPSSVTIPSNVTSIGWNAFQGCSGLETLTIPSTVTDIDGQAFVDCPNLKSVRVVRDGKIETMSFDDFFKKWKNVVAQRLKKCDFLLNGQFKKDAKVYLCLFSASWCGPCRREMPRIAKTYAESLKGDPSVELIHFSCDQNDEKALAWAKEHDVKFPVVKPKGGNPLNLNTRGIPHLFIVKADGTLVEEGHPMQLFTEEKLRELMQ